MLPDDLISKIDGYFISRSDESKLFSISDLCFCLGISVDELREMEKDPNLAMIVKRAITRICAQIETDPRWSASMGTFLLKQDLYNAYNDKNEQNRFIVELRLDNLDVSGDAVKPESS